LIENWKGNLNYWTGGSQGCKGFWGWCSGSEFKPFTSNLSWAENQPEVAKEKENCLHLRIFQNSTGLVLSDRECKDKYIFACQVFKKFMSNLVAAEAIFSKSGYNPPPGSHSLKEINHLKKVKNC